MATKQVYEALLDIDSNLTIVPQLATDWKPLDPTTWEFELRPDVTFHDGTPFTATDVVFSIERARAETSDVPTRVAGIAAVEAIDDHTVHITTVAPDPSLWLKLADVAIMSRAWAEQHGVTTPADYNRAREETYASRHANGTGPFMLEDFEPQGRYVLVRNSDWWGQEEYPHNVDRVIHIREDDAEGLAALFEGEIDLLQTPPHSALDQIRRTPGLKLAQRPALATVFSALIRVAPSCALPTSRGAIRSRTSGCAKRCPTRSTSRQFSAISWARAGIGRAATSRPRKGEGATGRGGLPGRLPRDPRLSGRIR